MTAVLALLLLTGIQLPLPGQSLFAPRPLAAYRINEIVVDALPGDRQVAVRVTGSTPSNPELLLFRTSPTRFSGPLSCYFYLEEDVTAVRVSVSEGEGALWSDELPVEPELLSVRLFDRASAPLPPGLRFVLASSPQQLGPGDVYLARSPAAEAEVLRSLLARGVHVLLAQAVEAWSPEEFAAAADPLRGKILGRLEDFGGLAPALEQLWDELLEFKQRFVGAVSGRRLQGLPLDGGPAVGLYGQGAEQVAFALEGQAFDGRAGARQRLALLGFYVPALAVVIGVRRLRWVAAVTGALLLVFLLYVFLCPGQESVLLVELNPRHLGQAAVTVAARGPEREEPPGPAAGLCARGPRDLRVAAVDHSPAEWQLRYRALLAPGGRTRLTPYLGAERVRFDQLPRVTRETAGYALEFTGILRSWSLHEPR